MKLERLLEHIKINNLSGDPQCDITGVNIDSRRIAGGHLFIALRGTQTDGHAYIGKAIELGARAILCETLPDTLAEGVTYVVVDSTEDVVGQVATTFYGDPTSKVELVGVTGTNGKTTIATLLYKMFRHFGYKVGLLSTVCNYIDDEAIPTDHTTPDPITLNALLGRMADEGCKYVFMEVSSHSVAQKRIGGLRFAGGIFTNLTRDHLDYHKTFENYLKAKKAFFDGLPKSAFALTNADDRNGMVMVQNTRARVATYSLRSLCDFQGKVLEDGFEGMLMDINGTEVNVQFIGRFNASNLLAVYGAAVLLGKKPEDVLVALSLLRPVAGRFDAQRSPDGYTAIVDYAHTPRCPGECAQCHPRGAPRPGSCHHRGGSRRQPRQGQASADGTGGCPPERPPHHHVRQPPLRGTASHHRRHARRADRRGQAEDPLHRRPSRSHPHCLPARPTGRCHPGGRQGTRGLSGDKRRETPLRRPRNHPRPIC